MLAIKFDVLDTNRIKRPIPTNDWLTDMVYKEVRTVKSIAVNAERVNWDGKTATGIAASNGTYIAHLIGQKTDFRKSFVLVK
jgi:flagellar hook assembly protein FlgD